MSKLLLLTTVFLSGVLVTLGWAEMKYVRSDRCTRITMSNTPQMGGGKGSGAVVLEFMCDGQKCWRVR